MYAFSYEAPGNEAIYNRVKAMLGAEPEGLVLHMVDKTPGGLRHLGVWQSKGAWENYRDKTVRPVLNKLLAEMGIPEPPLPAEETLELVDIYSRQTS
jgi:hypothetical protein